MSESSMIYLGESVPQGLLTRKSKSIYHKYHKIDSANNCFECKIRRYLTPVPQVLLQLPQEPQLAQEESLPWMKLDEYKNMFLSEVKFRYQFIIISFGATVDNETYDNSECCNFQMLSLCPCRQRYFHRIGLSCSLWISTVSKSKFIRQATIRIFFHFTFSPHVLHN